jgi:hypothetical protein
MEWKCSNKATKPTSTRWKNESLDELTGSDEKVVRVGPENA